MTDDQELTAPGDDPIVPPAPPATIPLPPALATPLAPPLSPPPAQSPAQPGPPAAPPYATSQAYPAQPGYPAQPPYAQHPSGYPLAPGPQARAKPPARLWLVLLIAIVSVAAIIVVTVFISVALLRSPRDDEPQPGSGPIATPSWPGAGSDEESGDVGAELQAEIDEYENLRDTGALWQQIPDDDFNRTAVQAFLYLLIDMKSATLFGVDSATAEQYRTEMAELESRLLAQQPLGTDIELDLGEGRVFRYDGTTGAGGYSDE